MKKESHKPKRWLSCNVEAEYFGEERKSGKKQRKQVSAKDRSKYKKTDLQKADQQREQPKEHDATLLSGRVLSISSQGVVVEYGKEQILCILRGALKQEKTRQKNLIIVGDCVRFQMIAPGEGVIKEIEPRKTFLSRAETLHHRKEQLIAANIDQVLITTSVVRPNFKPSLIDRYIIASRKGGMHPVIVINKIDLLENSSDPTMQEEKELYLAALEAYAHSSIPVISVSAERNEGLEALMEIMKDKTSVFTGQSGVGKSSLLNLLTGGSLEIGHIVDRTRKGSHTTTQATVLLLPFGGWCIDTPGIRSFGIWDLQPEEIEANFEEIHALKTQCAYPDCTHMHETNCAVKQAVEDGSLSELRYNSYCTLIEETKQKHRRR